MRDLWLRTNSPADARQIESLNDVKSVLGASRVSFVECMDCVAVAQRNRAVELQHAAALRGFEVAVTAKKPTVRSIESAAMAVVSAYIQRPSHLHEVPALVEEAKSWLTRWPAVPEQVTMYRRSQLDKLDAVLLLLSDSSKDAAIRLSKWLRRVDRPDLALQAVQRFVTSRKPDAVVLTTCGAALCDLERWAEAVTRLRSAEDVAPRSRHVLVTLSRALQGSGDADGALKAAWAACEIRPDAHAARRLLAAALEAHDGDGIDVAQRVVRSATEAGDVPDIWMAMLAVEVLMDSGKVHDAQLLMREIEQRSWSGALAGRVVKLRRQLAQASQLRLGL